MRCPTCGENYILTDRVRAHVHKQQIRDPTLRNTPYGEHFDLFLHIPFFLIKEENEQLRKAKENYFINLFKPKLNCL
jgi:hypothetical protein